MENSSSEQPRTNYERVEFSDEANSIVPQTIYLQRKLKRRNLRLLLFVAIVSLTFGALISYGITSRSFDQNSDFKNVSDHVNIAATNVQIKKQRQMIRSLVDNAGRLDKYITDLTKIGSRAGMPKSDYHLNYVKKFWSDMGLKTFNKTYHVPLSFIEDTSESVGIFICNSSLEIPCEKLKADYPLTEFEKIDGLYPTIYPLSTPVFGNFSLFTVDDLKYLQETYKNEDKIKDILKDAMVLMTINRDYRFDEDIKRLRRYAKGILVEANSGVVDLKDDIPYPLGTGFTNTSIQFRSMISSRFKGDLSTVGYPSKEYAVRDLEFYDEIVQSRYRNQQAAIPLTKEDVNIILDIFSTQSVRFSKEMYLKVNWPMKDEIRPIHNICTQITGSVEPDRVILVGGHRDSWHMGALDPQSGTASLLEMSRVFKVLTDKGWQPRRTIMFCSWDGEEVALIGSNEYVEEEYRRLDNRLVSYFNTDTDIMGTWKIMVHAYKRMEHVINETFSELPHPNKNSEYHFFLTPDVYSDYYSFWHNLGVPTVDYSFTRGYKHDMNIYELYHTKYDTVKLYRMIDPGAKCHLNLVRNSAALILTMVDSPLFPVNMTEYAMEIKSHFDNLKTIFVKNNIIFDNITADPLLEVLDTEIKKAVVALTQFQLYIQSLSKKSVTQLNLRILNDKMTQAQKTFVYRSVFPVADSIHLLSGLDVINGLNGSHGPPFYKKFNRNNKLLLQKYLETSILSLQQLTGLLTDDFSNNLKMYDL